MLDRLRSMIDGVRADFVDIRYEIKTETLVDFVGKEIKSVGSNRTDGYVVRVGRKGGFSSATVTREEDVPRAIELACEGADTIVATGGKRTELAEVSVVQEVVGLQLDGDPRRMDIDGKIRLTRKYNDLMLEQPSIETTSLSYREIGREKSYVNSEGTSVSEELVTTNIAGEVVAKRDDLVQNVRVAIGGADGFNRLLDRDDVFIERALIAGRLLDARPVKGGTYDVVLNPSLAGVFTHEAFGHFSEADIIEDNPSLRAKMALGERLGSEAVTIVADSTIPGQIGYYRYDDEGVAVRPVTLMDRGVLTGRLHSRSTAKGFGEPVSGHAVAEDMRFEPIVRMGTIYIKPAGNSLEDLLGMLGDGLYLLDGKGGQTSGENFTFGAQYGFLVRDGKIGPMVRDINIMGNLFSTLQSIDAVGDEMELSERGGCGKGQMNIKSALGGPSVLIRKMVVGGA
ncbi:MAG: TldD/PmbA family protein [Candidatus Fermentibacteraceae bacterium]|nr:TldD/PmbA family protein [Candidatus Fermentibacteraceae bacterium]